MKTNGNKLTSNMYELEIRKNILQLEINLERGGEVNEEATEEDVN